MSRPQRDRTAEEHHAIVQAAAAMAHDRGAKELANRRRLQVLSLTWEDTGRYQGSAVGPNISDMTIQVQSRDERGRAHATCMPVIRAPNFTDRTGDLPLDEFYLLVGNERGAPLRRISLRTYLDDLRRYLSWPETWPGEVRSLLAARDTHVLVSAQACFLPVPKQGIAEFNPVLFNYQSRHGDPAVLAVLVTREGTSATVIDNTRDGFSEGRAWGQRLFFNHCGERASLTGQRVSDFVAEHAPASDPAAATAAARQLGLNTVLLIQVPLKQKTPSATVYAEDDDYLGMDMMECERGVSDVEDAVIGHGELEGAFTEIDHVAIERDERFPIRVTVQFYKATSNGVLAEAEADAIAEQIERVYAEASFVGSLVVDGDSGRPTEWDDQGRGKLQPPGWWADFWIRYAAEHGASRAAALRGVWDGDAPYPASEAELDAMLRRSAATS